VEENYLRLITKR